jgi:dynein heavy chain
VTRGRRQYVPMGDKHVELHPDFRAFFVTRLRNPVFSAELQAKTTVVDFTVTMQGLEEQLLARVIGKEQRALEELLTTVLEVMAVVGSGMQRAPASCIGRASLSTAVGDCMCCSPQTHDIVGLR